MPRRPTSGVLRDPLAPPPRRRRRGRAVAIGLVLVAVGVAGAFVVLRGDGDDDPGAVSSDGPGGFVALDAPVRLLGGPGGADGRSVTPGEVVELDLGGLSSPIDGALVDLRLVGDDTGTVTLFPCGAAPSDIADVQFGDDRPVTRQVVVAADGGICLSATAPVAIRADALATLAAPAFTPVHPHVRIADSRPGTSTVDGRVAGTGRMTPGDELEIPVGGRGEVDVAPFGFVVVTVLSLGQELDGTVTIQPCDAESGVGVDVRGGSQVVRSVIVPVGEDRTLCARTTTEVDLVVDLTAVVAPSIARPLQEPARVADTRADGRTIDERFQSIGVRPGRSVLELPLAERVGEPEGASAVIVDVTAADPLESGRLSLSVGDGPELASVVYRAGRSSSGTATLPLLGARHLCVSNSGRTDVVVDVIGFVVGDPSTDAVVDTTTTTTTTTITTTTSATTEASSRPGASGEAAEPFDRACSGQSLFPDHRLVALYGTPRTERLGVLGEQDAEASVDRVAEIAELYEGDRPVRPAFELIATLATRDAGDDGLHRLRSEPSVVQEYLDVARRHGYYLILDLQPGWSDFLTEAKYYEEFLREPDVGLALDPEWRTRPPRSPVGGFVGQTDAAEVQPVIDWLAQIVEEERLPEKLLVLHQFQARMIEDRDQLVERPGVALTVHMDGFGTRGQKQATWSEISVEEPWSNGLKLFFDEDVDRYKPDEILAGAFEPVPDLITYQ